MQAVWKLALRCLLVFCAYVTTAGGAMSIRTGFPAPGLIGTFMFWFICTKVVQALNKDKDDAWAWLMADPAGRDRADAADCWLGGWGDRWFCDEGPGVTLARLS